MIKHWTSNHPLPKIWEKLLMLLITRCIPPAMLGLGRAKKLELFNFDLHDFSSPSCLPCEKITNNKSSQTLQKDSSSLKRTNKNAREKEIYILYLLQEDLILVLVSWVDLLCQEQRLHQKCSQWRMEEPQISLHDLSLSLHKLAKENSAKVWDK